MHTVHPLLLSDDLHGRCHPLLALDKELLVHMGTCKNIRTSIEVIGNYCLQVARWPLF